jgi:hypothetical protein
MIIFMDDSLPVSFQCGSLAPVFCCCANNRFAARHKRRNKKTNAGAEVKTIEVPALRLSLSAIVTASLSDLPMALTKAIF